MDFLYNFFQTCDRSKYFKRNFCDRSPYSLYNFKGPAIDRSKFSKELHNRSDLKAIIVQFLEKLRSISPKFQRNWAIGPLKCYYYFESYDRSVQIFKGIGRLVHLKCYYCWESGNRSEYFQRIWVIVHKI